jgi:hypothetical protein
MAVRRVAALGVCLLLLASLPCIGAPPLNQVDEEDLNLPVVRGVVRVSKDDLAFSKGREWLNFEV